MKEQLKTICKPKTNLKNEEKIQLGNIEQMSHIFLAITHTHACSQGWSYEEPRPPQETSPDHVCPAPSRNRLCFYSALFSLPPPCNHKRTPSFADHRRGKYCRRAKKLKLGIRTLATF
ncbi:hypothetical protein QVD17_09833 [Tagetes erecta]|uniref:Uncharacterized protein n=1 Tax=Tagetes erecta TaxID=13708 RepID=A0AAD8NYZ4_TARER|nr:hypothetical protein QVD17_09833 [Tagetes erecta]